MPSLVIAAGGRWTELLGDAAVVPLPATPERIERAIAGLRAAPLFTGGRGRPPLDVPAAARLAAAAGELLLERGLALVELNPVLVHDHEVTMVDAAAAGELLLERGLALVELNPVLVHDHEVTVVDAAAAEAARGSRSPAPGSRA